MKCPFFEVVPVLGNLFVLGGGRYMRESNGRPYQETDPGCFCCNPEGFFWGDGLDWGNLTLKKNAFSST